MVEKIYKKSRENIKKLRVNLNRPLTLTEKILAGHLEDEFLEKDLENKINYVFLKPDRVALQDVTGQMVMLQFMQAGLNSVSLPTTVHCDHLIQARTEGKSDTKLAIYENNEVYKFLELHQVDMVLVFGILEQESFTKLFWKIMRFLVV